MSLNIDKLKQAINLLHTDIKNDKYKNIIINIYNSYGKPPFEYAIKDFKYLGWYPTFCEKYHELSKERFIIWLQML